MKKSITVIVIIVMLFNLISVKSYAEEDSLTGIITETLNIEEGYITETDSSYFDRLNDKKSPVTNAKGVVENFLTTGLSLGGGTTFSIIWHLLGLAPQIGNQVLEWCIEFIGAEKGIKYFTIYDTVMGNYELFNFTYNSVPETEPKGNAPVHEVFKFHVIRYYNIIRNLSIALSLFVLIYIGIRMAISTVASDKAKYSKMLYSWLESLLIVIFMHYIIIIISEFLGIALGYVKNVAESIKITEQIPVSKVEYQIYSNALLLYQKTSGWNLFSAVVTLWIIVYYQFKFFMMYIGRLIEIGFLIIISPLVTITYSIDKAGDGVAQAFKAWFSELLMKALIQLIHAILYCIFIASAGYIATKHPLLAALFFGFLSRSEKIVKNIFSIKNNEFERARVPFMKK